MTSGPAERRGAADAARRGKEANGVGAGVRGGAETGGAGRRAEGEAKRGGGGGLQLALRAGFLNRGPDAVNPVLPEHRGLRRGLPVRIAGLKAAPEFNGEEGKCVKWDANKARWQVRLRSGPIKVLKPENLEELYSWSVHNGYISHGDVILCARMTIEEAIVKCASLPECRGFCFEGGLTEDVVEILFKSKWDLVPEGRGWLSYQKVVRDAEDAAGEGFTAELAMWRRRAEQQERARQKAEEARRQAREAKEAARSRVEAEAAERRRAREREWRREEQLLQRPDYGCPTADFEVGDMCEVVNGSIVRRAEELESEQLRQLPNRAAVEVVEIGTGPTGKRLLVRDRYKREGWVSVVSARGEALLRVVHRQAPAEDASADAKKRVEIEFEVDEENAPYYVDMLQTRLEEEGVETFDPRFFFMEDDEGVDCPLDEPLPLETMAWPLRIRYAPPEGAPPAEIPAEYRGLPNSTLGAWRPDALPVRSVAAMIVSTVFERMHSNHARRTGVLELCAGGIHSGGAPALTNGANGENERPHFALPWEGVAEPSAEVHGLSALERTFRDAVARGDQEAVRATAKRFEEAGAMTDFVRRHLKKSWRGPLGFEPFEWKGKIYTMRSIDNTVYDKTMDFPVAIWNAQSKRVEAVKGQMEGDEHQTIKFFDKTYHLTPRGEFIDPIQGLILGAWNPATMNIETIDPVPIKWKEFMDTRGFRLEAGSTSSCSRRPFIQILGPKRVSLFGLSRDEVANSMGNQGKWKMLKSAGRSVRGDRDLVLQTLRLGAREGSWRVLLHSPQEICQDREVILEAAKQDPGALALADVTLRKDRDLMLAAVRAHALALRHADETLRNDRALVLEAVRQSWRALREASPALRGDRDLALEAVRQSWQALEFVSDELCADRDIVREAISQSWRAVQHVAEELRTDHELMLLAARQSPQALSYMHRSMRSDRAFMSEVVRWHGRALGAASAELRADRDLALRAVSQDWRALQIVAPELRGDRELVHAAVEQDWQALRFAAEPASSCRDLLLCAARRSAGALACVPAALLEDRDFALEVVRSHPEALERFSPLLHADPNVVAEAARHDVHVLRFAPGACSDRNFILRLLRDGCPEAFRFAAVALRADVEIAEEAVRRDWALLAHVAPALRADRGFIWRLVDSQGLALSYADADLRADRALVLRAVRQSGRALEHAAEELRDDREVVLEAVRQDWEALAFASEELRSIRDFACEAVRLSGQALRYVADDLREDEELVLEAIRSDWRAVRYAGHDLRADRLFLQRAVRIDALVLTFASEDLRNDSELVMLSMEATSARVLRPHGAPLRPGPPSGAGRGGVRPPFAGQLGAGFLASAARRPGLRPNPVGAG